MSNPHPRQCLWEVLKVTEREMVPWQYMQEVWHEVNLGEMWT